MNRNIHSDLQFNQTRWPEYVILLLWVAILNAIRVLTLKLSCVKSRSELFIYHLWAPAVRGAWEQPVWEQEVTDEMRKLKINERRTKQVGVRNKQIQGLFYTHLLRRLSFISYWQNRPSLTAVKGILGSIWFGFVSSQKPVCCQPGLTTSRASVLSHFAKINK